MLKSVLCTAVLYDAGNKVDALAVHLLKQLHQLMDLSVFIHHAKVLELLEITSCPLCTLHSGLMGYGWPELRSTNTAVVQIGALQRSSLNCSILGMSQASGLCAGFMASRYALRTSTSASLPPDMVRHC